MSYKGMKYHAVLDFGYGRKPIKFTVIDLDALMMRFHKEVYAESKRRRELQEYTYVEPNLTVEIK